MAPSVQMNLLGGGLDFCAVVEHWGVPLPRPCGVRSMKCQMEARGRFRARGCRAPFEDARSRSGESAVGIAREHGNGGVLMPSPVFAA